MKRTALKRKSPMGRKKAGPVRLTLNGLIDKGVVVKASSLPRKPMRKRSPANEGWIDVAREIALERQPCCEVCGRTLRELTVGNMSHLLPRGSYPDFKRRKDNIRIQCEECHSKWHRLGPGFLSGLDHWKRTCELYYSLRDEANGLKP